MAEDGDRRENANEATTSPSRAGAARRRRRGVVAALSIPLAFLLGGFGVDRGLHGGQVLRGVTVAGVSLGGKDRDAAAQALGELETRLSAQPLPVSIRQFQVALRAEQIDYHLSVDALLATAMETGRSGNLLSQLGWWLGRSGGPVVLPAVGTLDAQKLSALVAQWQIEGIDDPPFEGAVMVRDDVAVGVAPRPGTVVDSEPAAALIVTGFGAVSRPVLALPLVERQPLRGPGQVDAAVAQAKTLLSAPIDLLAALPELGPDPVQEGKAKGKKSRPKAKRASKKDGDDEPIEERFRFTVSALASALRSRLVAGPPAAIEIYLDGDALEPALTGARAKLEHPPVDAAFVIDKRDQVTIRAGRPGAVIDAEKVAAQLLELGAAGKREGPLPVEVGGQPKFTTEAAKTLGIKGLVKKFTTRHPCCRPRVKNIHRMADLIDGVILKPGERFSINDHVGERTPRRGFLAAPTIVHGKMKDTIGGGVSQFATTFFNAAFHGGYEIVERQAHSYYFRRYPMGHEATLSFPKPDVIIRNDTEAGLLIRTSYTGVSITVKLFGANGGRKVTRKVSHPRDVTDPPIEYIADPELEPDEEKVKVRGQVGWTVIVARITEYPDGQKKKEQRKVVYRPRVRKVRVHPCKIPKGEEGHTGEPCPEPEEEEEEDVEPADESEVEPEFEPEPPPE
jgi:vancomycin resistance protein YoaR